MMFLHDGRPIQSLEIKERGVVDCEAGEYGESKKSW